ncbi:phage tail tape measure protein [Paenibacillus sp. NRS-1760]|uniref:phage tail tape measure protein n=1 Tax=Paenibacillus sp. NRS-1760 TaxID=3233902 RepID=UPI003D2AB185
MAGKIYKIAFELASKLEGSYNSNMTKVLHDLTELERKARDLNSIRVSGDMVNSLRTGLQNVENQIRTLDALRITGHMATPLRSALVDIERKIRTINSLHLSGDIVRPLQTGLRHLVEEFRHLRTTPFPNGVFTNLNVELREAVVNARHLLQSLRLIGAFRMPGNMFRTDMRDYLRDVTALERRMRDLQNAGGPGGGGGGGGGAGGAASSFDLIRNSALGAAGAIAKLATGGILLGTGLVVGTATLIGKFTSEAVEGQAQLQAATGATAMQMITMKKTLSNIYKDGIGEDYLDVANSIAIVKQVTKQSGDELERTTRNAIAYRDVFQEDITQSIKGSDTMVKNFGISSAQAFNLLAEGAQKGLNKSGELIDSANEYAPHFAKLGFTAEQMFDTFSAGLDAGAFNLDKVGDAIKEFNIRSKDMSKTSINAYKSLGMNAEKMSKTFAKGGPEAQKAFAQIVKAISSIEDPVKKNAVGVEIFGTQFEDIETDVIKAMGSARKQFDMTKDTLDQLSKVKYDTPMNAFKSIGRILQVELLQPIGEELLPDLKKFGDWAKKFANEYAPQIASSIKNAIQEARKYIGTHFLNNPEFQKLKSIESKVDFIFTDIKESFNKWWESDGRTIVKDGTEKLTDTMILTLEKSLPELTEMGLHLGEGLASGMWDGLKKSQFFGWFIKWADGTYVKGAYKYLGMDIDKIVNPPITAPGFSGNINGFSKDNQSKPNSPNNPDAFWEIANAKRLGIGERAKGGLVTSPELSWLGEGGYNEWIIPENNSKRSRDLLSAANSSMGYSAPATGGDFVFSPTYYIYGNADQAALQQLDHRSRTDFGRQFDAYKEEQRRVNVK